MCSQRNRAAISSAYVTRGTLVEDTTQPEHKPFRSCRTRANTLARLGLYALWVYLCLIHAVLCVEKVGQANETYLIYWMVTRFRLIQLTVLAKALYFITGVTL